MFAICRFSALLCVFFFCTFRKFPQYPHLYTYSQAFTWARDLSIVDRLAPYTHSKFESELENEVQSVYRLIRMEKRSITARFTLRISNEPDPNLNQFLITLHARAWIFDLLESHHNIATSSNAHQAINAVNWKQLESKFCRSFLLRLRVFRRSFVRLSTYNGEAISFEFNIHKPKEIVWRKRVWKKDEHKKIIFKPKTSRRLELHSVFFFSFSSFYLFTR